MAGYPDAWLAELLSRTDMVSLVSEYVALKPKGGRMWGCCPFHNEKTPSFAVTPDKQLYYCFGCHKGGSAIQFLMEMEKISFGDAVRALADKANMPMPDRVDEAELKRSREVKERLYEATREAALYFHSKLKSDEGKRAREYLAKRGVTSDAATQFGLGFAPIGWDNLSGYLREKGYSNDELVTAGLAVCSKKNAENVFDMFRDRVVFPIIGGYSRVIGFGARAMGDEQPKYLNTSETPIFNKRYNLYNLNSLKGKNASYIVLVEGYMDVVSLCLHGITSAVATLGTALTAEQAKLIKRFASRVYVSYDGDDAGQQATLRALGILSDEGVNAKVIQIPDKLDPDDYVRRFGKAGFEALIENAMPQNAFKLANLAGKYDLDTVDGKEAFAVAGSALVARFPPVERERYTAELSRLTGYSRDAIEQQGAKAVPAQEVEKNRVTNYRNTMNAKRNPSTDAARERVKAECQLIRLVFDNPSLASEVDADILITEGAREVFDAFAANKSMAALSDEAARFTAEANALTGASDYRRAFNETTAYIRRDDILRQLDVISQKVTELSGKEREELLKRQIVLLDKLSVLDKFSEERGDGIER